MVISRIASSRATEIVVTSPMRPPYSAIRDATAASCPARCGILKRYTQSIAMTYGAGRNRIGRAKPGPVICALSGLMRVGAARAGPRPGLLGDEGDRRAGVAFPLGYAAGAPGRDEASAGQELEHVAVLWQRVGRQSAEPVARGVGNQSKQHRRADAVLLPVIADRHRDLCALVREG